MSYMHAILVRTSKQMQNVLRTRTSYMYAIHVRMRKHNCKMYCVHAHHTCTQYMHARVNITAKNIWRIRTLYMHTIQNVPVNITAKCIAYMHVIHVRMCIKHNCNMCCVHARHTCTQYMYARVNNFKMYCVYARHTCTQDMYARLNNCKMYCVHARHTCTQYKNVRLNITATCTAYTHFIHVRNTCTHV